MRNMWRSNNAAVIWLGTDCNLFIIISLWLAYLPTLFCLLFCTFVLHLGLRKLSFQFSGCECLCMSVCCTCCRFYSNLTIQSWKSRCWLISCENKNTFSGRWWIINRVLGLFVTVIATNMTEYFEVVVGKQCLSIACTSCCSWLKRNMWEVRQSSLCASVLSTSASLFCPMNSQEEPSPTRKHSSV